VVTQARLRVLRAVQQVHRRISGGGCVVAWWRIHPQPCGVRRTSSKRNSRCAPSRAARLEYRMERACRLSPRTWWKTTVARLDQRIPTDRWYGLRLPKAVIVNPPAGSVVAGEAPDSVFRFGHRLGGLREIARDGHSCSFRRAQAKTSPCGPALTTYAGGPPRPGPPRSSFSSAWPGGRLRETERAEPIEIAKSAVVAQWARLYCPGIAASMRDL